VYVDVENGCHKLLKALHSSALNPAVDYEIRAYMGNSITPVPKSVNNRTFIPIRNDIPLKELTDIAILLDLHDGLKDDTDRKHVLMAGNDKRYAAMNHRLRTGENGNFRFLVNYNISETLRALAAI